MMFFFLVIRVFRKILKMPKEFRTGYLWIINFTHFLHWAD